MTKPKVTIIILNWNGKGDTSECLDSLHTITYPNYEILLVDNGSIDGSVEYFKKQYQGIEIIENKDNLGFAEGNNVGIKHAIKKGTDYVLLLNNDTVVDPKFLQELVEVAESKPNIGIVGPKIYYYNYEGRNDVIWFAGGKINWWLGRPYHSLKGLIDENKLDDQTKEVDFITGCCMLLNVKNKDGILLNKDYFAYFEDADLCVRLQKNGYKLIYAPSSKIWHKISKSSGFQSEIYNYFFARNRILFMKNHARFSYKIFFYPYQVVFKSIMAMLYFIIKYKNPKLGFAFLRGTIDGLKPLQKKEEN